MNVQLNPKGSRQHGHTTHAMLLGTRSSIESLIGIAHGPKGDSNKISAEWFLITGFGGVTVADHWTLGPGAYAIKASTEDAAREAVKYFKDAGLTAYILGEG